MVKIVKDIMEPIACEEGEEWVKKQKSIPIAWRICKRGDWMAWLIGVRLYKWKQKEIEKKFILCMCACVRHIFKGIKIEPDDDLMLILKTVESFFVFNCIHKEPDPRKALRQVIEKVKDYYYRGEFPIVCATLCQFVTTPLCTGVDASDLLNKCIELRVDEIKTNTKEERLRLELKKLAECATIIRRHFPKISDIC